MRRNVQDAIEELEIKRGKLAEDIRKMRILQQNHGPLYECTVEEIKPVPAKADLGQIVAGFCAGSAAMILVAVIVRVGGWL